ncbi:hypothetical protein V6N13_105021 [Hibiscus sabdariffa]
MLTVPISLHLKEDAVEVEDKVDEEKENINEFEVSDDEFGFDDEGLRYENIGIWIRVQRQMDGFRPDGVKVNLELESYSDKSDELNNDHDSDSDGFRSFKKGKLLKDDVWKGSRATYLRDLKEAMKQLKALSVPACVEPHLLVEKGIKFMLASTCCGSSTTYMFMQKMGPH